MDDDELWRAIDDQRERTADLLDDLDGHEWTHPSLCPGWTVRDVAAHLTLQQLGLGDVVRSAITNPRSLGGLNRTIRITAQDRSALPVEQLIGQIRAMIGSRRHNVGVTSLETLIDILVHGQDMAIPLGRQLEMPVDACATAATRVWSYGGKGKAHVFAGIPLQGYRLVAADTHWAVGEGPECRGPIGALLLLVTGRQCAAAQLEGAGVVELRRHLDR